MDEFDVTRLTDFDFEVVCKDLFEEVLGVRLEIFAEGKDQGVDLRHFGSGNRSIIVQCKHWVKSGRAALIRQMENTESHKVRRLKPDRYLLATTADLTVASKKSLAKAVAPFLHERDIYGLQEINAELRRNPEIVRRHLRLWLSSATILQQLLNKAIHTRSAFLAHDLEETFRRYAANPSTFRARSLLARNRICVIAGTPGVGKTTLAQVLCSFYLAEGYELFDISADVEEAAKVWNEGQRQIFYYDDFLGQNFFQDRLKKNEDARIIQLLKHVARSKNKLIVLTTRGYILEQARRSYEKLSDGLFDLSTCLLDLSDYNEEIRAAILYNHLPLRSSRRK